MRRDRTFRVFGVLRYNGGHLVQHVAVGSGGGGGVPFEKHENNPHMND